MLYMILTSVLERVAHLSTGPTHPCPACVENTPHEIEANWGGVRYGCYKLVK